MAECTKCKTRFNLTRFPGWGGHPKPPKLGRCPSCNTQVVKNEKSLKWRPDAHRGFRPGRFIPAINRRLKAVGKNKREADGGDARSTEGTRSGRRWTP